MVKEKKFLMYWRRFGRRERTMIPRTLVDKSIMHLANGAVEPKVPLKRFNPEVHIPATQQDSRKMEQALWEGWELAVDEATGEVWIGNREEKVAACIRR